MILKTKTSQRLDSIFHISLTDTPTVLSVSDSVDELLGFKADDFLSGKVSLPSLVHAHDQDIAEALFSNEIKPASGAINLRLRHADGRIRCVKGLYTKALYSKALDHTGQGVMLELLLQEANSLWQQQAHQPMIAHFKAMMENTNDYIYFKDRNHVFTGASQTLVAITNPSEHWTDLIGKTGYDVFPEAYADIDYRLEKQVFAGIHEAHEVQETLDKHGNKGWVDNRKYPLQNEHGEIVGLFGIASVITERKQADNARIASEQRFRDIVNTTDGIVWEADATTFNFTFISQRAETMLGYSVQDWLEPGFWVERLHPDDKDWAPEYCASCTKRLEPHNFEYRFIAKDGRTVWLHDIVTVVEEAGQPRWLRGIMVDITERKKAEKELVIAAIAFEAQEGMLVADANNIILRVNNAFTKITGYSSEEALGKNTRLLNSGRQSNEFYAAMWHSINSTGAWQGEIWNRRKNGEIYPEHLTITAVKDSTGIVTNYVATLTDITISKAATEEIKNLAFYDSLTQLPNRRLLLDRLKQALTAGTRSNQRGALLFLDLDNFKTLNDTLGHDIGDLLLQQVAERLTWGVREGDTVARIGGDEFVVILENLSEKLLEAATQTEVIANKILASLNRPYQLASHEYYNSPSIGATLFSAHELGVEELLKQADIAMYEAKKAGRNTLRFFDPVMQQAINTRAALEHDLRKALECKEFQLHYQVQVNHKDQPLGAEALIRWYHPERGLVSPFNFIPLAEETGLILPIGQWVLDTACAQLKLWEQDELTSHLTISVNVSAKQFRQADFAAQVQATIIRHAIDPKLLNLELTESMLLEDVDDIIVTMNTLREIGIWFELDDFGTGYSSLQYLKKLPLSQLKIDQSFVHDIAIDSSDRAIIRTIITMAQNLNLEVIAEGVETEEQRQLLLDNGCLHYQGYLFGRPVPIGEFEAFLKKAD